MQPQTRSQKRTQKSIGVTILGSTGSIGVNTLDVLERHRDRFHVVALTGNNRIDRLFEQCRKFQPAFAVMLSPDAAQQLEQKFKQSGIATRVLSGIEGLEQVASDVSTEYVMAAIVGAAGLRPALSAARAGKRILLANKEALVMSGRIFLDEVKNSGAQLLPIDSEHNAIFQCMPPGFGNGLEEIGVRRILLTASGGPFRKLPLEKLRDVTPEQACAHPNWVMGKKISVDSATMMNKGLEVIEACWLFGTAPDNIQVVLHPQSVIHSMVEYADGSVLAQMGNPDMRTPIAHALAWPNRFESGVESLNLFEVARLDFEEPDLQRFPCLRLAIDAMRAGGASSTILNAANEIAVQAFLDGDIAFTDIANIIEYALSHVSVAAVDTLESVLAADALTRLVSKEYINRHSFSARKSGQ
jgi:1-deoxy-D-xylulose-5-phosphate reductoisomerase